MPDPNRCLAPLPTFEAPSFALPPLACDTHAHVVADDPAFPLSAARSYTPPAANEEEYLRMLAQTGMQRGVLVQISVHGTDNRFMLQSLRRHPNTLRGIAVVDASVSESELREMHAAGVRGLRLNLLFGGGVGLDLMELLAERIQHLGWHLQLLVDGRQLPALLPRIAALPCPVVLDHMGHLPASLGLDHPGYQALLALVRDHGCWVKLSGAYRISEDFPNFDDVPPIAQALVAAAPDRTLWGSDWPHVAIPNMPDTGRLLNGLLRWAPNAQQRKRILVDNPARLYGFV